MKTSHSPQRTAGFSLVEIMVAVVVICVGLLGIAKMQALALSNTNTSRQRSIAAIEAASFASSMHSNREYWTGPTANNLTVQVSGAGTVVSTDVGLNGANLTALTNACIVTAVTAAAQCTPVQLAAFDLARWWLNSIYATLPAPIVTINCPGVAGALQPVSCTIIISWSEKGVSMNAAETAAEAANQAAGNPAAFERPSFMLYVEP